MPVALLIIGIVLAITAFRGTYGQLGNLLIGDFTNKNNFLVWIGALVIVGMIGYIPNMEKPSRAFLGLILLVIFLKNGGVFSQFSGALQSARAQPKPTNQEPQFTSALPIQITGGGGNPLSSLTGAARSGISSALGAFGG